MSKESTSGGTVAVAGATFSVHQGGPDGPVLATIVTGAGGSGTAAGLDAGTYCLEETAAPAGFARAPTYSPAACVEVNPDATAGLRPAQVFVTDPPDGAPAEAASIAAAAPPPPPPPRAVASGPARPVAAAAGSGMIGLGMLLLVVGLAMMTVALRRRRALRRVAPYHR